MVLVNLGGLSMKKLILVTSPPACGKTYVSKQIAKALDHVVYLDKDTLICLSEQIFKVANQEINRSSRFFEDNIRNPEYEAIVALALEALDYDDIVLINAPFTREIRDKKYMNDLKTKLLTKDAKLVVIWVETTIEVCKQRMMQRNSPRDKWKIEHWDEYIAGCNFEIPTTLDDPNVSDDLLIFKNSSDEEYKESIQQVISVLENE
jgi:dephospho-CoA kinase